MAYVLAFLFLFVVWFAATFNGLVAKRNQASNAFASIDVNLKKRHDLIPNVVSTLEGFMT